MALKITCPHCSHLHRLSQPYPVPGTELQCQCGRVLSVSYPQGMMDRLRAKGIEFSDPAASGPHSIPAPDVQATQQTPTPPPATPADTPARSPVIEARKPRAQVPESGRVSNPEPTRPLEPTPAMPRGPRAAREPTAKREAVPFLPPPTGSGTNPTVSGASSPRLKPLTPSEDRTTAAKLPAATATRESAPNRASGGTEAPTDPRAPVDSKAKPPTGIRAWVRRILTLSAIGVFLGGGGIAAVFWYFSGDLPTVEALGEYEPPTVTVVYDAKGRVLGEIYKKRRYVIPLEDMPDHLKDAFLAAEDANFWKHDGVDVGGIFRAIIRNLAKGKKAQGASTITQQVARNFLLTREKTFVRKIREVILAQRVEEAFEKEHILYLYLNQIYLGSGAYGVEAAARTYFGKSVGDLTLGESAILAGLPQRPSVLKSDV